jgi:hypothetical protein
MIKVKPVKYLQFLPQAVRSGAANFNSSIGQPVSRKGRRLRSVAAKNIQFVERWLHFRFGIIPKRGHSLTSVEWALKNCFLEMVHALRSDGKFNIPDLDVREI